MHHSQNLNFMKKYLVFLVFFFRIRFKFCEFMSRQSRWFSKHCIIWNQYHSRAETKTMNQFYLMNIISGHVYLVMVKWWLLDFRWEDELCKNMMEMKMKWRLWVPVCKCPVKLMTKTMHYYNYLKFKLTCSIFAITPFSNFEMNSWWR